jgi:hypothetical protein
MRDNWLSNQIFKPYDDPVDHCCEAWNKLVDQPWRIMFPRIAPMDARVLIDGPRYINNGRGRNACLTRSAAGPDHLLSDLCLMKSAANSAQSTSQKNTNIDKVAARALRLKMGSKRIMSGPANAE